MVNMMVNNTHIHRIRFQVVRGLSSPRGKQAVSLAGWFFGGFCLSAGALARASQPLSMGLICAGRRSAATVAAALGAMTGYLVFWGAGGIQGVLWCILALITALTLGDRPICTQQPLFLPAVAAVIVSGSGVFFLLRRLGEAPVGIFLLRVLTGATATLVFRLWLEKPGGWTDWLAQSIAVLALAQIVPVRFLGLGFLAAGYFGCASAFPAVALTGLALDLSGTCRLSMTGVLSLGFCLRLIPVQGRLFGVLTPAMAYLPVAWATVCLDFTPVPGLLLGGLLRLVIPGDRSAAKPIHRRGHTAVAQVRLEQMALALRQMEQALLIPVGPEPDKRAVLDRARDLSCDNCPERRQCRGRAAVQELPLSILEQPGLSEEDIPTLCRKKSRLLNELRRGQEQLRRIKGDRSRLLTYRTAAREQYGFLADFLQLTSDSLAEVGRYRPPKYQPEVYVGSRSSGTENGDNCVWFPGPGNVYYVLLCDGMGTGEPAARESGDAIALLKTMLSAGLPAEYALRSLNSLAILGEKGGCTTVDLVQLRLDTGRGTIYKWGAAPSYLLRYGQVKKIGTAGPPPGLSQAARETVDRLSLQRGEVLILLSDGAGEDVLLRTAWTTPTLSPGELAAAIAEQSGEVRDDATAVVVRLSSFDATAS